MDIVTCLLTSLATLVAVPVNIEVTDTPPEGVLTGRLVTLDRQPVGGARVWLNGADKRVAEAKSDSDGRFRLGPLEPTQRHAGELLIEADTLPRTYVSEVAVFAGTEHDLGEIVLAPGRRFVGQVLGDDVRVLVTASHHVMGHTITYIGSPCELTTDGDGRFHTPVLPVGKMSIEVRSAGHRLAYVGRNVLPGDGDDVVEPIRLEKDHPIAGVVQDEQARPIAGAEVWLFGELHATADAEGRFVLRGFGPDPQFQLFVQKDDFLPYNDVPKDKRNLTVTLKRPGWIVGRAEDAETGRLVTLSSVKLCQFERQPDGSIVRSG